MSPLINPPVRPSSEKAHRPSQEEMALAVYQALTGLVESEAFFAQAAKLIAHFVPLNALVLQLLREDGSPLEGYSWREGSGRRLTLPEQKGLLSCAFVQQMLAQNLPVLLLEDTREHPLWASWAETIPHLEGLRSALWFSIPGGEGVVGIGIVARRPPHSLGDEEAELAQGLAEPLGHLSIALRKAITYREQAQLSLELAQSVQILAETLDPDEVVYRVLVRVQETLHVEAALLFLYDEESQAWVLREALGKVLRSSRGQHFSPPEGILERLFQHKETLWVADLSSQASTLLHALPITGFVPQSGYAVPIQSEGRPVGVMLAINPAYGGGQPWVIQFLNALASVAGVSLTHARLFAELEQAHQEYRTLFNDTLDWILITDLEGHIVEANQTSKEALGLSWEIIRSGTKPISQIHTPDPKVVPENFEDIPSDPPLRYESEVTLPNGDAVPVEVYVRRVTISGRPRLQWILRDITEAKQLETLREDLLSMIYHDLRSPLANIVSGVDVLESLHGQNPTSATVLDIIRRSADRVQRLTSTLLDIRRLEAGQPLARPKPVQPRELIYEAVDAVAPLVQSKGHTLEVQLPEEGLPPVMADAEMIRRVLINLLENASKYTPDGGHIWVGAREEPGGWVRFWVRDTGPGIPLEEQEHLFEKYTRASTAKIAKGLGLGLAYCRLAVEAHNGEIGVYSKPGEGATFYFTLPIATAEEEQTSETSGG